MKKHNTNFLNYFSFLIKVLFFISISLPAISEENQIGLVSEINGDAIAINDNLDERDLSIFDPIFSNEEIFATQNSSLVLQFNDNTSIIMKELTSLNVSEFENSKLNPQFKLKILKGNVIIESGLIAKNKNGEMEVSIKTSTLGLRGTRINADLNEKNGLNISLGEDNFGNTGIIEITNNGKKKKITSQDQMYEISKDEISSREKSTVEKDIEKLANETFVNSSTINEDKIEMQLISKLAKGKIEDLNNDGLINISDVEELKNQILNKKKKEVQFIINNTRKENSEFLSSVINKSDEKNTGEALEKIIDNKENLLEGVIEDLSDKNNKFLTTSDFNGAGFIKEKIFKTIVAKETDKSAFILSKVMSKSDDETISLIISNTIEKNNNNESKLSLKLISEFSENNPQKYEIFSQSNQDQISKLITSAIDQAASNEEDVNLITKVISESNEEINNIIIDEVIKNSIKDKQTLSAKVFGLISEINPNKIDNFNDENKKNIMFQTNEVASKQEQGLLNDEIDLSDVVSKIIINTDNKTSTQMIDSLGNFLDDSNSKLSLKVVKNLTKFENFEDKLKIISNQTVIDAGNVKKLIEKAIKEIDFESDMEIFKKIVIDDDDDFLINLIIKIGNEGNKSDEIKVIKILDEIIKKDPIKIVKIIEDNKEKEIIKKIIKTKKPKIIKKIKEIYPIDVSPN